MKSLVTNYVKSMFHIIKEIWIMKKDLTLNILGPVGDIVGEWIIKGAFLQASNFGQYDWSNSEVVDLEITVAMDYCVLNY